MQSRHQPPDLDPNVEAGGFTEPELDNPRCQTAFHRPQHREGATFEFGRRHHADVAGQARRRHESNEEQQDADANHEPDRYMAKHRYSANQGECSLRTDRCLAQARVDVSGFFPNARPVLHLRRPAATGAAQYWSLRNESRRHSQPGFVGQRCKVRGSGLQHPVEIYKPDISRPVLQSIAICGIPVLQPAVPVSAIESGTVAVEPAREIYRTQVCTELEVTDPSHVAPCKRVSRVNLCEPPMLAQQ
jgi:hypothetical protein